MSVATGLFLEQWEIFHSEKNRRKREDGLISEKSTRVHYNQLQLYSNLGGQAKLLDKNKTLDMAKTIFSITVCRRKVIR